MTDRARAGELRTRARLRAGGPRSPARPCSDPVAFHRRLSSAATQGCSGGRSRIVGAVTYGALLSLSACSGSVQPVEHAPPATAPLPVTVTLTWRAPQTRVDGSLLQNLAGYRVRYGTSPGTYSSVLEVNSAGVTELALSGLARGPYWFIVTAVDADGLESGYSNEATTIVR